MKNISEIKYDGWAHPYLEIGDYGITDKERIDFIERNFDGFSIDKIHDSFRLCPEHGKGDANHELVSRGLEIEVFTCISQHVYGKNVRNAIDCAIMIEHIELKS